MMHPDIDPKELRRLFQLFLRTLDDKDADDWYDTEREIAKTILSDFNEWLKKYQARKEKTDSTV